MAPMQCNVSILNYASNNYREICRNKGESKIFANILLAKRNRDRGREREREVLREREGREGDSEKEMERKRDKQRYRLRDKKSLRAKSFIELICEKSRHTHTLHFKLIFYKFFLGHMHINRGFFVFFFFRVSDPSHFIRRIWIFWIRIHLEMH